MTLTVHIPGEVAALAHRPAAIRKQRGLFQHAFAQRVGIHVSQIRGYEVGRSQPALDALRNLAVALSVSTNALVFNGTERGADDLRLQFEAITRLHDEGKALVKALLESVLRRHEARRCAAPS